MPSASSELQVARRAARAPGARPPAPKRSIGSMPTTCARLFRQRQRHAAAAAAGVEHASGDRDARRAPETRSPSRSGSTRTARSRIRNGSAGRRAPGWRARQSCARPVPLSTGLRRSPNLSIKAARSWPDGVSATSKRHHDSALRIGVEHVPDLRSLRIQSAVRYTSEYIAHHRDVSDRS